EWVSLKMCYGGMFVKMGSAVKYMGGEARTFQLDVDELCWFLLEEFAVKCGSYNKGDHIYYLIPDAETFEKGLRRVYSDDEVRVMSDVMVKFRCISCCCCNAQSMAVVLGYGASEKTLVQSRKKLSPRRKKSQIVMGGGAEQFEAENYEAQNDENADGEGPIYGSIGQSLSEENVDDESESQGLSSGEEWGSDSDTDDEEFRDSRRKIEAWNAATLSTARDLQQKALQGTVTRSEKGKSQDEIEADTVEDEFVSDYDESGDELNTESEGEDNEVGKRRKKRKCLVVNSSTDFSNLKWVVGIRFPNREEFKECVTRYAVAQGRNLTWVVSDKGRQQRLGVKCNPGCPFRLYCSWDSRRAAFVVKSVEDQHTCVRNMESNRQLKSTWLAKQFLELFKSRPHWPAKEMVETIRVAYRVLVKVGFAYKGILNAVATELPSAEHRHCARHIFASWHRQFKGDEMKALFWKAAKAYNEADFNDAIEEMEQVDPGAVIAIKAHNPSLFCRAFVRIDSKCDLIMSNMAETFNGYIIHARNKHLIYMLEDIRAALMQRMVLKKTEMEKNPFEICPRNQHLREEEEGQVKNATSHATLAHEMTSPTHHNVTAEPSRTGRGGRMIRGGRGSRGGGSNGGGRGEATVGNRGGGRGGRRGGGRGGRRGGRTPTGFGVLFSPDGTPYTNVCQ
ncbi:Antiviral helicase SKI2, partial [Bienertia sinuspersici]